MKRFTQLFTELDETNRTSLKVAAIASYFRDAPDEDACWALWFLTGNRLKRLVPSRALYQWAADLSGLPTWMLDECYAAVGDFAELLALVLPDEGRGTSLPLHKLIEERLLPLRDWAEPVQLQLLTQTWRELDARERFVFNKLLTGGFRLGVQRTLVAKALAEVAGVDAAIISHRLMGPWEPEPAAIERILRGDGANDPAQPYPFFLAYPIEEALPKPENGEARVTPAKLETILGPLADWQAEWKYDGIRAQLIRRAGRTILWSRGEDILTDRFPEIEAAATMLPEEIVLDGEVLAWRDDRPLSFSTLQRRIGRKVLSAKILAEAPVVFLVYDVLEHEAEDVRTKPLRERRERLEELVPAGEVIRPTSLLEANSWAELAQKREASRTLGVEGLMLKARGTAYGVGRTKGDWWKWKIDPYTVDAVMIYAQVGHGRRAGLFTDYTFALWHRGELVPVAKAYSGLTNEEIERVDRFVKTHTLEKRGPVRMVEPTMVFELAFEGIQRSSRHQSGVALRFPRMHRIRDDKKPEEADSLAALEALLPREEKAEDVVKVHPEAEEKVWRTGDLFG